MGKDEYYMSIAIKEAKKAELIDEVPIGAIIVKDNKIIARAHNLRETKKSATAHAEILAIEKANKKLGSWRLNECTLYVTLEPCPMCAGAIIQARINRVVFGALDKKGGSIISCVKLYNVEGYNHYPEYTSGVMEKECSTLLKEYFNNKRVRRKREKDANILCTISKI